MATSPHLFFESDKLMGVFHSVDPAEMTSTAGNRLLQVAYLCLHLLHICCMFGLVHFCEGEQMILGLRPCLWGEYR